MTTVPALMLAPSGHTTAVDIIVGTNFTDARPVAGQVYFDATGWVDAPVVHDAELEPPQGPHCSTCADLAIALGIDREALAWRGMAAWAANWGGRIAARRADHAEALAGLRLS